MLRHVEVRIAAVPAQMVQLAPGDVPASVASIAFADVHLVVMSDVSPLSSSPPDVEALFTHALAHLALDEALEGGAPVPAWFHEAFATHAEDTAWLARTQTLASAALSGTLLDLGEVAAFSSDSAPSSVANAQAVDFVRYLEAQRDPKNGRGALPALVRALSQGEPFDHAVVTFTQSSDRASLDARWRGSLTRRYAVVPALLALLAAAGLALGAWVAVRRSRRARAQARARRERPTPARKPVKVSGKVAAVARVAAGRGKDAAFHVPRELEVPKVEHNGEWHTLH